MGGVENEQKITELDLKGIISEAKNSLIKQAFVLPEDIDFENNQGVERKKIGNKNFEILVVDYETDDYNKYKEQSNNKYEIQRGDDGRVFLNEVNDNQSPKQSTPAELIQAPAGPAVPAAAGPAAEQQEGSQAVPAPAQNATPAKPSSQVNDEGRYNDGEDV